MSRICLCMNPRCSNIDRLWQPDLFQVATVSFWGIDLGFAWQETHPTRTIYESGPISLWPSYSLSLSIYIYMYIHISLSLSLSLRMTKPQVQTQSLGRRLPPPCDTKAMGSSTSPATRLAPGNEEGPMFPVILYPKGA